MVGMTICLHVATLVGLCVCVCLHVCYVCVCVFHATLQCVISQCVHVSVQAGREAAGRFWWKDCKL